MKYTDKELEKFAIDILRHYKQLNLFIDRTSVENVLNISYEDIFETKRLVNKLDKSMSSLSPIQRKLVKLRYLEGFDWQSTSERLGCSIRTAHNRDKEAINIIMESLFGENLEKYRVG